MYKPYIMHGTVFYICVCYMAVSGVIRSSYTSLAGAVVRNQQARSFVVCYLKTLSVAKIM
jgi:hypothetical protein